MATFSNGVLMSSSLSMGARRSMVLDMRMLSMSHLICLYRCASKDQVVPSCSPGCTSRPYSLDHGHGLESKQLARWCIPHCSMWCHVSVSLAGLSLSRRMTSTVILSFAGVMFFWHALMGMLAGSPMQSSQSSRISQTWFTVVSSYVMRLGTLLVRSMLRSPTISLAHLPNRGVRRQRYGSD